ncbi:MAG TPA: GNAT family N-acetyltransferase [Gemmatimonadaceae bacterium]|nr:GNAT family N-acetyltransferase [Gemmatimonadaceae bacterium]
MGDGDLVVRPATAADRAFVLGLVPRLRAFGPPPLRPAAALDGAERRALERAFDALPAAALLLVAEHRTDGPLGAAYAQSAVDYFTGETHGHLAILAVAERGEGRGVGRRLLAAVEGWATGRGYRLLTLGVFATNVRARELYERAGYEADIVRYAKELP